MNATEMAVLSGFWQKNGLGTLGVKFYLTSKFLQTPNFVALRIFRG